MLSDAQKADLHQSIVNYLAALGVSTNDLAPALGVSAPRPQPISLEQKWAALVRLQRRIIELEKTNARLLEELSTSNETIQKLSANAASGNPTTTQETLKNWLPKYPPQRTLVGHRGRVTSLAFHPQWSLLASGDDQMEVKIWDLETGEPEKTLRAHTRAVHGVCFSPNSQLLITCSADLSIKVFNPANEFANVRTMLGHEHTVSAIISFASNQRREYVCSASRDKSVRLWELETGFPVHQFREHADWVRCLSFQYLESKPMLLSAGSDRTLILRDLSAVLGDGSLLSSELQFASYAGHAHVIECCALAPAESAPYLQKHVANSDRPSMPNVFFASGGRDLAIRVWHAQSTVPILTLQGHENWVRALQFHQSGRFLFSCGDDKTLRVWDLSEGKLVRTINAHDHFVTSMALRNRQLATGSVDASVRIW